MVKHKKTHETWTTMLETLTLTKNSKIKFLEKLIHRYAG